MSDPRLRIVGAGAVAKGLDRAAKSIPGALRERMQAVVAYAERDLRAVSLSGVQRTDPLFGVTGSTPGTGQLGVRSGAARRSVVSRVFTLGTQTVIGVVGSPLTYVAVQEKGGTITGRPYLRIPTQAMQTPAGVDRLIGSSARAITDAFIFKSRRGNLWVARRNGGQLQLLYLLKRSVRLKGRGAFAATASRTSPIAKQLIGAGVFASVKRAGF